MPRSPHLFPLAPAIVLVLAGCGKSPEPAGQQTPAPAAAPSNTKAHMAEHLSKVREVEEAIIRGDLEAAKTPARWIADHQEVSGFGPRTERPVMQMKAAAKSVASTNDIGNAAIAAASLVGACGSCHAAAKVSPPLPTVAEETTGTDRKRHMQAHQHAIDRMYHGLISPTSGDWMTGAEALKVAPLRGKALSGISKEAVAAEARVHELATRALSAAEQSTRVTIYGSIIGSCATCHGLHGSIWGPGLPKGSD